ncbi:DUF3048 C-terminal domain-containing protein [Amycolatopsis pittospori]|nr:DUF3048 C-terminal domain-containing protein [Amycolatopsis pittospori]
MWRDGQRFSATWDRAAATAPTRFTTSGRPLPVSEGPLWILLVPA